MTDRRNTWSEAMDAELARMWAEGHTGKVIAAHFHKSRNAIIGRVHRLHLTPRPSPIAGHVPALPKPTAIRETRVESAKRELHDGVTPVPLPAPPIVAPPPPPLERVPSWGCAWLEGERPDWRRCDAPVWQGTSWCRFHFGICYSARRLDAAA